MTPPSRWAWAALLVAIVVLVSGAWHLGIDNDEQIQFSALLRQPILEGATAPFDLYDFSHVHDDVPADLARGNELVFRGAVKWCQAAVPVRVMFFRPLASALFFLEFRMFGLHFRLYHLLQLALVLAAVAVFTALWNRVLTGTGGVALSSPLVVALLVLNPTNQELLARICTLHYLLAALFGFGASLIVLEERLAPGARALVVTSLGALSLLASEAAVPVHLIGCCALAVHARHMTRAQRLAWALLLAEIVAYLVWYRHAPYSAAGWGYSGSVAASGRSFVVMANHAIDGGLDLFAGTFLSAFSTWRGFQEVIGLAAGAVAVVLLSLSFVLATVAYLIGNRGGRRAAAVSLIAAAGACIPIAAVGQPKLRVLAIASLPLQFLLITMARDSWRRLRGLVRPVEVAPALATIAVLAFAVTRLAADVALAPVAIRNVRVLSRIAAARWIADLGVKAGDIAPVDLSKPSPSSDEANILLQSATTGVPYPFGPTVLARGGFSPEVERWLFLSDLPPGGLQVGHMSERTYRVTLTPAAGRYHLSHLELFPILQRCFALDGQVFETRFAVFSVLATTPAGEPLAFDFTIRPGVRPRFWRLAGGRIVPAEMPVVGKMAFF